MKNKIINDYMICSKCNLQMNLLNYNSFIDKLYWRCYRGSGNNRHDVKTNTCFNTFLKKLKIDIRMIYFILFENFIYFIYH